MSNAATPFKSIQLFMILRDYRCPACNHTFEALVSKNDVPLCPACGKANGEAVPSAPKLFNTIVPTTRTSKKHKAGYVHSHGDRPATKVQVQGASFTKE